MHTNLETCRQDLVVGLHGTLSFHDGEASDVLLEQIDAALDADAGIRRLVFDIGHVDMVDSHWLGLFVRALRRAQASGQSVTLRAPQPLVRRTLELVQFGRVFAIEG